MRTSIIVLLALGVLSGCSTLPRLDQSASANGCNVRAGTVVPEGSASAGLSGGTVTAGGASATVIGDCPENFSAFARSPGGGWTYYGDPDLLKWMISHAPVTMLRAQYEAMIDAIKGAASAP